MRDAIAYRVPFTVDRSQPPAYTVWNESEETLHWVVARLIGSGMLDTPGPLCLPPGRGFQLLVVGAEPAQDCRVQLSWLREDDEPYLWSFTF